MRVRLEAEPADQFACARFRRLCLDTPEPRDEFEILEGRELVVDHRLVRQPGGDLLGGNRIGQRIDAIDGDRAGVGPQQPGHHAQGRGLAGAIGADQHIEFAAIDGEIERIDRGPVEALGEPANRERDGAFYLVHDRRRCRRMHGRSLQESGFGGVNHQTERPARTFGLVKRAETMLGTPPHAALAASPQAPRVCALSRARFVRFPVVLPVDS